MTLVGVAMAASATCAIAAPVGLSDACLPTAVIDLEVLPEVHLEHIDAEDVVRDQQDLPMRIAIPNTCSITPSTRGTWEHLTDHRMLWRLRIHSPHAAHINLGFDQLNLPRSATLMIYSLDGLNMVHAQTRDTLPGGPWWTPIIRSDELVIEIATDTSDRSAVESGVHLTSINHGYRGFGAAPDRGSSESCNIDVVCAQGDNWWNEIASVGVYTVEGSWSCSGFMINNTAEDQRPLFMTADHCGITSQNEDSVVVYWNHQNSYCRTPGSADSGGSGDGHLDHFSSGVTYRTGDTTNDMALVELNTAPDPDWGVIWAGWSRTAMPTIGAAIHHPECAEKRISIPDSAYSAGPHWKVNWSQGSTSQGSSGSPLFDANHRAIGQLCCGAAYCWNDEDDYYSKSFIRSWTPLEPWLDPLATNANYLDFLDPHGSGEILGACCTNGQCTYVTEHDCALSNGTWQGDGSTCAGNPCDPYTGDTCDTAPVASVGANAFDTTDATDSGFGDPDEDQCPGTYLDWDQSPDHWFRWYPPGTGIMALDTCDEDSFDTSVVLYVGNDCTSLVQVACNGDQDDPPDDCQDYVSAISDIAVTSGETYWIRIGGWQGGTGTGTLTLNFDGVADPTGGCCTGESCDIQTGAQCTAAGGTYLGDDTDCLGNPCSTTEDVGACCIGGECSIETETDCHALGGIFTSVGVDCSPNPCDTAGDDIAVRWRVAGVDLVSEIGASWTADIYLELPADWRLDAVAGNSSQIKTVASTTAFYQSMYGGPTSVSINPEFYPMSPDLQWDSRMTIGCLDVSGAPYAENNLGDIGIDWTEFESGGSLSVVDGTWFVLPVDSQGEAALFTDSSCTQRYGVLVARLTSLEYDSEILFDALFQGRDAEGMTWQDAASTTISYQGELDCNGNLTPDACDIASGESQDANANGVPDECEQLCAWDLNGDGNTSVDDLLILIGNFGSLYEVDDLLGLLAEFGCGG
ncbi:MAG: hypothetical protein MK077_10230 [Phycisphaerales bacterium]|nr:hypothetical protein [Phycisphaerales bacterium]